MLQGASTNEGDSACPMALTRYPELVRHVRVVAMGTSVPNQSATPSDQSNNLHGAVFHRIDYRGPSIRGRLKEGTGVVVGVPVAAAGLGAGDGPGAGDERAAKHCGGAGAAAGAVGRRAGACDRLPSCLYAAADTAAASSMLLMLLSGVVVVVVVVVVLLLLLLMSVLLASSAHLCRWWCVCCSACCWCCWCCWCRTLLGRLEHWAVAAADICLSALSDAPPFRPHLPSARVYRCCTHRWERAVRPSCRGSGGRRCWRRRRTAPATQRWPR